MIDSKKLVEKLIKIQALYEKAATEGEKEAALAAIGRINKELTNTQNQVKELKFSLTNQWSRALFVALLRKHKIKPYRLPRQKSSTVMAKMSLEFCEKILWPEFVELDEELLSFLDEATMEVIKNALGQNVSEPAEADPR